MNGRDKAAKPPLREDANNSVARRFGIAIVTGRYAPGTVLPSEVDVAELNGVSRSVVREAMRTLSAKGLIESRRRTGTRVRDQNDWNLLDPELLRWMFEGAPPRSFVRDLFQLRLIVEPAAAEIAAANRTAHQLSRMGHALEVMATAGLASDEGRAADQQFHAALLQATNNQLLVSLSASIAAAVRWTTFFKYRTQRSPRDPIEEHQALFEAIAAGNGVGARAEAERLVRQALVDTEASLLD